MKATLMKIKFSGCFSSYEGSHVICQCTAHSHNFINVRVSIKINFCQHLKIFNTTNSPFHVHSDCSNAVRASENCGSPATANGGITIVPPTPSTSVEICGKPLSAKMTSPGSSKWINLLSDVI